MIILCIFQLYRFFLVKIISSFFKKVIFLSIKGHIGRFRSHILFHMIYLIIYTCIKMVFIQISLTQFLHDGTHPQVGKITFCTSSGHVLPYSESLFCYAIKIKCCGSKCLSSRVGIRNHSSTFPFNKIQVLVRIYLSNFSDQSKVPMDKKKKDYSKRFLVKIKSQSNSKRSFCFVFLLVQILKCVLAYAPCIKYSRQI